MGSNGRKKRLKHFSFIFMNHWGGFYLLPSLSIDIVYSQVTWSFVWLVFRVDWRSYNRLPDWFMKYVWSVMNFDFLKKKRRLMYMTQEEQEAIVFEQEQNWDYGYDLDDWLL